MLYIVEKASDEDVNYILNESIIWEKSREKVSRLEIQLKRFSADESQSIDQIFSLAEGDDMWRFNQVF
jgi:hypothetical protein